MEYNEFIKLLAQTRLVITDSGGLQEETSFLKKKCIVCRKKTERLEGVGTFAYMCPDPKDLEGLFSKVNDDHIPVGDCPYGDGYAAKKVFGVLRDEV
jgi:UDP-N-acetylglucosamine 2-epimerase (non-hydrolysing)